MKTQTIEVISDLICITRSSAAIKFSFSYVPKAFFCSNVKSVLQIKFELQSEVARDAIYVCTYILALYVFVWRLNLHEFDYKVTYLLN